MENFFAIAQIHENSVDLPVMDKKLEILIILITLLIFTGFGYSQNISKRSNKLFSKAKTAYISHDIEKAEKLLKRIIKKDSVFTEAWLLLGDINLDSKKIGSALFNYKTAIKIDPEFFPGACQIVGDIEYNNGNFKESINYYSKFLGLKNISQRAGRLVKAKLRKSQFAEYLFLNPVPYNPKNLGDSINSEYDEYINSLSLDGSELFFTKKQPAKNYTLKHPVFDEKLYYSNKTDSIIEKAKIFDKLTEYTGNIGALSLSPDGKYLFFSGCHWKDGFGSCDIYYSKKNGNNWGKPKNLGNKVNTQYWESQPCFSSDGKTLFFASNRKGGMGDSDIWKTEISKGKWSAPINLGDSINTEKSEMSPFIHFDGRTLYFSSKGHPGMGKADLFYSQKNKHGNWQKPKNLGYPVNTIYDEINIIINAKGNIAYISSDLKKGKGKFDIYEFELHEKVRPEKVTYLKGFVYDEETKKPLQAFFELIDLSDSEVIVNSFSDAVNGEFLVALPTGKEYALNVSKKKYLFYSDHFHLSDNNTDPIIKNIPLKAIKSGAGIVLKNIFFKTDKYKLKKTSIAELNKLLDFLKLNNNVNIEIGGHTDNTGSYEHNKVLSEKRAGSVYDFLTKNGIKKDRLQKKGYGSSVPIDTNTTEEGKANNRRTEIEIIDL